MSENIKAVFASIAVFLLVVALAILGVYITISVGYLLGLIIVATPYIGEWITVGGLIDSEYIPGIISWLSLVATAFGTRFKAGNGGE